MRVEPRRLREPPPARWIAEAQLGREVLPLELQLPGGLGDPAHRSPALDAGGVEAVAPSHRLVVDGRQERADGGERIGVGPEAEELRVRAVSPRPPREDLLGEERLAPERDEAAGVQVLRVQGPEPHAGVRLTLDLVSMTTGTSLGW